MDIEETAHQIIGAALNLHREMGPGLLESAYESMLEYDMLERGLRVKRQVYVDIKRGRLNVERAFCIDLLVNECIIVEVKAVEVIHPVHVRQLLTYLKMKNLYLGLLLNFGQMTLKEGGIRRILNGFEPPK